MLQFTLKMLLLAFVFVWSSMALFGPLGVAIGLVGLLTICLFRSGKQEFAVFISVLLVPAAGFLSLVQFAEYSRRSLRWSCTCPLKWIGRSRGAVR